MTDVKSRIHPNTLNYYDLEEGTAPQTKSVLELLNSDRLDVMARYIYAKSRIEGRDDKWSAYCYEDLMNAWWQDFKLPPPYEPGRSSMQDYWDQFNDLIQSVKDKGFDPKTSVIPTCDGNIIDGAHRLAVCLASGVDEIPTIEMSGKPQIQNYETLKNIGVNEDVLRYMMFEFVKLKKNTRIAVLFPVAQNIFKTFKASFKERTHIDYIENFPLSFNGLRNLQNFFYGTHEWWNDVQAHSFATSRTSGINKDITILFFQENDPKQTREIKENIRKHHSADNHVMHTTDTHEETILAAEILLNQHARHYLENAQVKKTPKFEKYFSLFSSSCKEQNLNEKIALDTGSTLALYGLRDIRDIDYISNNETLETDKEIISRHDEGYDVLDIKANDIIYNPQKHFMFNGIKFVSLNMITQLKKARAYPRDLGDLQLIEAMNRKYGLNPVIMIPKMIARLKYKSQILYFSFHHGASRILKTYLPESVFLKIRGVYRRLKGAS